MMQDVYEPHDHVAMERVWTPVRIQLLGGFRVTAGDRAIPDTAWRTRKARSLIKLLCLAANHQLHREAVLDLLWPELEREVASNNLRSTLYAARRALEPDRGAGTGLFLQLRRDVLVLDGAEGVWIDVDAFEAAAVVARRRQDLATCEAALDLYTGDLLPEDRYEDWAAIPRVVLKETYLGLLVTLAQLHESQGEHHPAITALERVVAADPTHEDAHVGLMRLHAMMRRHGQALRQYARLSEALDRELDVEPSAPSRQLHAEIVSGRFPAPGDSTHSPKVTGEMAASGSPSRWHNLPTPLTRFIGRRHQVAEIGRLLQSTRLLTLVGPGGSGKSRLALELAWKLVEEYRDGVWLVELASLTDQVLVPRAVATAVGIREQPRRAVLEVLAEALRSRSVLLVLDNCEHLVDACAVLVDTLLAACPQLRVLTTSREALGVSGEVIWRVPPLSLPAIPTALPRSSADALEHLAENEAVALFVDRVRWVQPGFVLTDENAPAVIQICHRLDGMPLAMELAAARVSVLAPNQLAARLDDTLRLLSGGIRNAPSRQQTLRATLDWSYDLLDTGERALLRRLAVFVGSWPLESAETICAGPVIGVVAKDDNSIVGIDVLTVFAHLVDKSLVQVEEDMGEGSGLPSVRYRLLETVRQYASEQLAASGESTWMRERHAAFYLALAEEAEPELTGPDQAIWLGRLAREHDNLRVALVWLIEHGDVVRAARLCAALWRFWDIRGHLVEGERWLADVLVRGHADGIPSHLRARLLQGDGILAWNRGNLRRSEHSSREALTLFQECGDRRRTASTLHNLGIVAELQGEYEEATHRYEASLRLREEIGDSLGAATTMHNLGNLAREQGDLDRASALYHRSLALHREIGNKRGTALALTSLAVVALDEGRYTVSAMLSSESLELYQTLGDKTLRGIALNNLGYAVMNRGDHQRAIALQSECLLAAWDIGDKRGIACGLEGLGAALALGVPQFHGSEQAGRLFGAAEALREILDVPLSVADYALIERPLVSARITLGETVFNTAWTLGRALPLDDVIAEALTVTDALPAEPRAPIDDPAPASLSRREREVATLLVQGQTNAQIAATLGIAERTADTHVSNLLRKLGVSSRSAARAWAIEHHLVPNHASTAS